MKQGVVRSLAKPYNDVTVFHKMAWPQAVHAQVV